MCILFYFEESVIIQHSAYSMWRSSRVALISLHRLEKSRGENQLERDKALSDLELKDQQEQLIKVRMGSDIGDWMSIYARTSCSLPFFLSVFLSFYLSIFSFFLKYIYIYIYIYAL